MITKIMYWTATITLAIFSAICLSVGMGAFLLTPFVPLPVAAPVWIAGSLFYFGMGAINWVGLDILLRKLGELK